TNHIGAAASIRPRRGKVPLLVGASLATAALTFAIVMGATKGGSSKTTTGSAEASGGSSAGSGSAPVIGVNQATGPEAGMADAPITPVSPVDASEAKKDATLTHSAHPGAGKERGKGWLDVTANPDYLSITVDGQSKGDTPQTIELEAGDHK